MRVVRPGVLLVAASLALTACSGESTDGESSSTSAAGGSSAAPAESADSSEGASAEGADDAAAAYPVTIEHTFGSTEITEAPQRVVTVGWGDKDFACDLGVVPVGVPATTWGGNENQSTDEFDACVKENDGQAPKTYSDADGVPLDEIAAMEPDLILATNSGITEEEYKKLSSMAPVVAYPGAAWGTSWQESLTMVGKALGKSEQAATIQAETEKSIDEAVATYPELEGKTAAWVYLNPSDLSKISLYTSLDNRSRMLEEFGLTAPSVVKENEDGKAFFVELSSERAAEIDADLLVTYVDSADQMEAVKADPNLGQIPALKNDAVVTIDNANPGGGAAMSSPTTLTIESALEDVLPKLAEAAQKADSAQ